MQRRAQFALMLLVVILPLATSLFSCVVLRSHTEKTTHEDHFSVVDPKTGAWVEVTRPGERVNTYYGWPLTYNSNYGWFSLLALFANLSIASTLVIAVRQALMQKHPPTRDCSGTGSIFPSTETKLFSMTTFTTMSILNIAMGISAIVAVPVAVYVNVWREGMPFSSWIAMLVALLLAQGILLMWSGWRWSHGRWRSSMLANLIAFLAFLGCNALSEAIW